MELIYRGYDDVGIQDCRTHESKERRDESRTWTKISPTIVEPLELDTLSHRLMLTG